MPKCLVVEHVPPESAFAIADALRAAHVEVDTRRVFDGDEVPTDSADLDGLIVMGGPMSAQSDRGFPTRSAEIGLLADALDRGVPSLGVCLGAQLLAVAAGGSVSPGDGGLEVGWGPVDLESACAGDALFGGLPSRLTVMHWHGDTFALPGGSERLMSNSNYANQAFRAGRRGLGRAVPSRGDRIGRGGVPGRVSGGGRWRRRRGRRHPFGDPGRDRRTWRPGRATVFDRFAGLVVARATHRDDLVDLA